MPEDVNKERTVGDLLSEIIDDKSKKMNDVFTKLFIYGPELFKIPIKDLEEQISQKKNKSNKKERSELCISGEMNGSRSMAISYIML